MAKSGNTKSNSASLGFVAMLWIYKAAYSALSKLELAIPIVKDPNMFFLVDIDSLE
ncbi:MAG: hypothetical protein U1C33_01825 [Candidatus Cloacimonadaceae bacterium]|nr:hypothetical protein [Candidatus Cloacimonadaceae bacterium]